MRNKIIVVEKDLTRGELLVQSLTEAGYFVIAVVNGEKALDRIWKGRPDLIILASRLDGMSSMQFVNFLRTDARLKNMPVFLISESMPPQEIVHFFKSGIDDHVLYSTPPDELLARIRALLRRVYQSESDSTVFEYEGLVLDSEKHRVLVDGQPVVLTRKEFELLRFFISSPEKVISIQALLNKIWGYDKDVSTKTLQVHINRLRKKLGPRAGRIRNYPGVGYGLSGESDGRDRLH